jgi:hypothetical protein
VQSKSSPGAIPKKISMSGGGRPPTASPILAIVAPSRSAAATIARKPGCPFRYAIDDKILFESRFDAANSSTSFSYVGVTT